MWWLHGWCTLTLEEAVRVGAIVLCSWARHVSLHLGVYKWLLVNLMLGGTL